MVARAVAELTELRRAPTLNHLTVFTHRADMIVSGGEVRPYGV